MTHQPKWGYQAFEDGKAYLKFLGHEVVSPHDMDINGSFVDVVAHHFEDKDHGTWQREFEHVQLAPNFSYEEAMKRDIEAILTCDGASFLPRWRTSSGSRNEVAVCKMIGLPLFEHDAYRFFQEMDPASHRGVEVGL